MKDRLTRRCDRTDHLRPADVEYLRAQQASPKLAPDPKHPLRCVRRIAEDHPDLIRYIREQRLFEAHGIMPKAGGLNDQPARWLAAISVIGSERAKADESRRSYDDGHRAALGKR